MVHGRNRGGQREGPREGQREGQREQREGPRDGQRDQREGQRAGHGRRSSERREKGSDTKSPQEARYDDKRSAGGSSAPSPVSQPPASPPPAIDDSPHKRSDKKPSLSPGSTERSSVSPSSQPPALSRSGFTVTSSPGVSTPAKATPLPLNPDSLAYDSTGASRTASDARHVHTDVGSGVLVSGAGSPSRPSSGWGAFAVTEGSPKILTTAHAVPTAAAGFTPSVGATPSGDFLYTRAVVQQAPRPVLAALLTSILDDHPGLAPIVRQRYERAMASAAAATLGIAGPAIAFGVDLSPTSKKRASVVAANPGRRFEEEQDMCAVHGTMRSLKHLRTGDTGLNECVPGFHCLESSKENSAIPSQSVTPIKSDRRRNSDAVGASTLQPTAGAFVPGRYSYTGSPAPQPAAPAVQSSEPTTATEADELELLLNNLRDSQLNQGE